jgi:hypothetical protein
MQLRDMLGNSRFTIALANNERHIFVGFLEFGRFTGQLEVTLFGISPGRRASRQQP